MGVIWASRKRTRQPGSIALADRSNPLNRGLRGAWDIGTSLLDLSGNGAHIEDASVTNPPTIQASAGLGLARRFTENTAGTEGPRLAVPWAKFANITGSWTVVASINAAGQGEGTFGRIFDTGTGAVPSYGLNEGFFVSMNGPNQLLAGNTGGTNQVSGSDIVTNRWHLTVVTYNAVSGNISFFVDGKLSGTPASPGASPGALTGPGRPSIGNRSDVFLDRDWDGLLGPLFVYDRAWSAAEAISLGSAASDIYRLLVPIRRKVFISDVAAVPVTVDAGAGVGIGSGLSAGVASSITIDAAPGAALGSGLAAGVASSITLDAAVGAGVGAGHTTTVASAITVDAAAGAASAAGLGAAVASAITVDAGAGAGAAGGLAAGVASSIAVDAATGATAGAGLTAGVASSITVDASTGAALGAGLSAGITTGNELGVSAGAGLGFGLAAVVSSPITVDAAVGSSMASGLQSTVGIGASVAASVGAAAALGLTTQIAGQIIIPGGIGAALGAGLPVVVSNSGATLGAPSMLARAEWHDWTASAAGNMLVRVPRNQ